MQYIYLHGFASSPNSTKAQFFTKQMSRLGHKLIVPDLNQGGFNALTISRQIMQVKKLIDRSDDIILFGSSMGGFISLRLILELDNIKKIVLLAPAIHMYERWHSRLGAATINQWKHNRTLKFYHYGYNSESSLDYGFIEDLVLNNHDNLQQVRLPTLIFHGIHDDVIPIQDVRDYVSNNENIQYHELDDGHSLVKTLDYIWQVTSEFI